ncbi:hypothetical protein D9M71_173140 [compost metagenome]
MGNADITGLALLLQLASIGQLGLPIAQVVDLQQVDFVGTQALEAAGPLRLGFSPAIGGDLGGQEALAVPAALFQQLAENAVGAPVVGRGVDHPAAAFEKCLQHRFELKVLGRTAFYLETARRTGTDHRQRFTGGRDFARKQTRRRGSVQPRAGGGQQPQCCTCA